jgi:alkylated DNA repair dioxygenase AlkB
MDVQASALHRMQHSLFAPVLELPEGMRYETGFLSPDEEAELLSALAALPLSEARYKEWTARRRIVSYGGRYDFSRHVLHPAPPLPPFLHSLRERVGGWCGIPAHRFTHALVAEYSEGTPLGWHRDVPNYEAIVGVSLSGQGRMRLRPYPPQTPGQRAAITLDLAPRSVYILQGPERWAWQHAISPTRELRYSITFRTLVS